MQKKIILQFIYMGLLSDGGVHSHNTHLYALLETGQESRVLQKFMYTVSLTDVIHLRHPVKNLLQQLEAKMKEIGVGEIACCFRTLLCNGQR